MTTAVLSQTTSDRQALLDTLHTWATEHSGLSTCREFLDQYAADRIAESTLRAVTRLRDRSIRPVKAVEAPAAQDDETIFEVPWPGVYTVETEHGHRTFRVHIQSSTEEFAPGETMLEFLSGPSNTSDYTSFGMVKKDGRLVVWRKFRGSADLLADAHQFLTNQAEALKAKHCARCGDKLTVPLSVERGFGPTCYGKGLR